MQETGVLQAKNNTALSQRAVLFVESLYDVVNWNLIFCTRWNDFTN
jgi:hypothetical protein